MKTKICLKTLGYCVAFVILTMFFLGIVGVRIVYYPVLTINWQAISAIGTIFVGIAAVYIANQGNTQNKIMNENAKKERLMEEVREAVEDANQMFYPTFFIKKFLTLQNEDFRTARRYMVQEIDVHIYKFFDRNLYFLSEQIFLTNEPYQDSIIEYSQKAGDIIYSEKYKNMSELEIALLEFVIEHYEKLFTQSQQYIASARKSLFGD